MSFFSVETHGRSTQLMLVSKRCADRNVKYMSTELFIYLFISDVA